MVESGLLGDVPGPLADDDDHLGFVVHRIGVGGLDDLSTRGQQGGGQLDERLRMGAGLGVREVGLVVARQGQHLGGIPAGHQNPDLGQGMSGLGLFPGSEKVALELSDPVPLQDAVGFAVTQAEAKISSPSIMLRPGLAGLCKSQPGQQQAYRHPLQNHPNPRSFDVFVFERGASISRPPRHCQPERAVAQGDRYQI